MTRIIITGEIWTQRETCTEGRPCEDAGRHTGHVKTEADIRVMQPQVLECREPPEAERSKLDFSPTAPRGSCLLFCQLKPWFLFKLPLRLPVNISPSSYTLCAGTCKWDHIKEMRVNLTVPMVLRNKDLSCVSSGFYFSLDPTSFFLILQSKWWSAGHILLLCCIPYF